VRILHFINQTINTYAVLYLTLWYGATLRYRRGRLVQDRSTKEPKLNCRNWECGVLVPITDKMRTDVSFESSSPHYVFKTAEKPHDADKLERNDLTDTSIDIAKIFRDTVPVPMLTPGRPYTPDLKPWYYMET
jgi:hypothetical protein